MYHPKEKVLKCVDWIHLAQSTNFCEKCIEPFLCFMGIRRIGLTEQRSDSQGLCCMELVKNEVCVVGIGVIERILTTPRESEGSRSTG
jgi:hypothetical protein